MNRKPTHEFTSEQTIDFELPLIIRYNISRGYPESPPSFSCGGEPETFDEIEDISLEIDMEELVKQFKEVQKDPAGYGLEDELIDEARENLAASLENSYDSLKDR